MGSCYNVYLKVKFTDEEKAALALQDKISWAREDHVYYSLDHYQLLGIGSEKLDDLLQIFFGGWYGKLKKQEDSEGWLTSDFDASYGWEGVMMDAFDCIAPYLEDGSEIEIYPDSGKDHGIVENGKVNWLS